MLASPKSKNYNHPFLVSHTLTWTPFTYSNGSLPRLKDLNEFYDTSGIRLTDQKTKKEVWILEASPPGWKRKGLRVFREKVGVLAELENNLQPKYYLTDSVEIIEEKREDFIRFIWCHEDGFELSEYAQAIPIKVDDDLEEVWILGTNVEDTPRTVFEAYSTREEVLNAFLKTYEKAGRPLTFYYTDEKNILEYSPDYCLKPGELEELAVATLCLIEEAPTKLRYECPACHRDELYYIQQDYKYVVVPRYERKIVHDSPTRIDSSSFKEKLPFYICPECFHILVYKNTVVRDKEMLTDYIINEIKLETDVQNIWQDLDDFDMNSQNKIEM